MKFAVKNLRKLAETPLVEIRPITILVGKNSSGKSTFLRSFPLLRQSMATRTSTPVMWYGDLVDFGSFKSALRRDSGNEISFTLDFSEVVSQSVFYDYSDQYQSAFMNFQHKEVKFSVSIAGDGDTEYISKTRLLIDGGKEQIEIDAEPNGKVSMYRANGQDILKEIVSVSPFVSKGNFVPRVFLVPISEKKDKDELETVAKLDAYQKAILKIVKPHFTPNIKELQIRRIVLTIQRLASTVDSWTSKLRARSELKAFKKIADWLDGDASGDAKARLQAICLAASLQPILVSIEARFRNVVDNMLYIGPARARSERYYRYQNLAVSEIDSDGRNFPMFLSSLSLRQQHNFSDWIKKLFGYGVSLSKSEGHLSINLQQDGFETNVIDTGYGVSQSLPVLGQIWWARNRPSPSHARRLPQNPGNSEEITLIAIEQPELHLHPAHQALIVDAMVDQASEQKMKSHFIIETHSEAIINKIGALVADKAINQNDVQVLIFQGNESLSDPTEVRVAKFTEQGELLNWPYGFFEASF